MPKEKTPQKDGKSLPPNQFGGKFLQPIMR